MMNSIPPMGSPSAFPIVPARPQADLNGSIALPAANGARPAATSPIGDLNAGAATQLLVPLLQLVQTLLGGLGGLNNGAAANNQPPVPTAAATPSVAPAPATTTAPAPAAAPPANTVAALTSIPSVSTLGSLVQAADLVPAVQDLEAKGPLTIFAPSNEAFAKLDPALVEKLKKPENKDALQSILKYHISATPGGLNTNGSVVDSLNHEDGVRVFGKPDHPQVLNGDKVIGASAPIKLGNGTTIVPINDVLIPPNFNPATLK